MGTENFREYYYVSYSRTIKDYLESYELKIGNDQKKTGSTFLLKEFLARFFMLQVTKPAVKSRKKIIGDFLISLHANDKSLIMDVKIEAGWKEVLQDEFSKPYFQQAVTFIKTEKALGKTIYPPGPFIFNAFNTTPFDKVKVVLLGQDPYHGYGQAHGLSFSVPDGVNPPPSLINIFKELHDDIGIPIPKTGNLTKWALQGILLLNSVLTVRANEPTSHSKIGWMEFTNAVIRKISEEKEGVVFLLWGRFAQEKQILIDETKHHVLKASHPSPLGAYKGFFGCRHFSKTNGLLVKDGKDPIDWMLD